jgi:hypothetical protein
MTEGEDILQREQTRASEETGLSSLLDYLCWDTYGAGGDLAEGGGEGVCEEDMRAGWGFGGG